MALETNQQFLMTPLVSPWNDSKMKNKWRNSILMMCHYPDLGSASDWSCHKDNVFQPIRSHTQMRLVTCHQYGVSVLIPHFQVILRRNQW